MSARTVIMTIQDKKLQIWRGPSHCVSSNIYYISTFNSQHIQRPDVYYNWVIPGDMFLPL